MPPYRTEIECTAYCSCGYCCNWEWGLTLPGSLYLGFSPSWLPVHLRRRRKGYIEKQLPLFARYWTATSLAGSPYYGLTSVGNVPAQARPPILSKLSLMQYKKLPGRLLLPWRIFPRHGTIAADTDYYPFGTRMFIPGYGWGEVEDRGSAIKGPGKIDLYHRSHTEALKWGRKKLQVCISCSTRTGYNRQSENTKTNQGCTEGARLVALSYNLASELCPYVWLFSLK